MVKPKLRHLQWFWQVHPCFVQLPNINLFSRSIDSSGGSFKNHASHCAKKKVLFVLTSLCWSWIVGKQAEGCFSHDFGWPKPKQPTWLGKVFSSVRYNVHLGVKRHFQLKDFKTNTSLRKSDINNIISWRIQQIWSPLNLPELF